MDNFVIRLRSLEQDKVRIEYMVHDYPVFTLKLSCHDILKNNIIRFLDQFASPRARFVIPVTNRIYIGYDRDDSVIFISNVDDGVVNIPLNDITEQMFVSFLKSDLCQA